MCPQQLLDAYRCTILNASNMSDPYLYQNLLCADGYSGNMCAVCTPTASGQQTAMKSGSFNCEWVPHLKCCRRSLFLLRNSFILPLVFDSDLSLKVSSLSLSGHVCKTGRLYCQSLACSSQTLSWLQSKSLLPWEGHQFHTANFKSPTSQG